MRQLHPVKQIKTESDTNKNHLKYCLRTVLPSLPRLRLETEGGSGCLRDDLLPGRTEPRCLQHITFHLKLQPQITI